MRKGSITTWLSLILLVLLSLITAGLYSARQAAGRVVLASAAEQALFSTFGQYDKDLMDTYGLLFIDGGYGGSSLLPGHLLQEIEEEAGYILQPKKGLILTGRDPVGIRLQDDEDQITGYVLATDDQGRAFRRQVCEIMQKKLGPAGLLFLQNRLTEQQQQAYEQKQEYETYGEENAEQYYQEDRQMFGPRKIPLKETETEDGRITEIDTSSLPAIASPLDTIHSMQAAGVLLAVHPGIGDLSAAGIPEGSTVSQRTLQKGMNMAADGWEGNGEQLLLLEYLAENFPCYTSEHNEKGLQYQVEYAIGGKNTDRENLQEVLFQLLVLREITNFLYLMKDPVRRQEADSMANILSLLILTPEAAPAISFALKAAWAYGESILDLRNLLDGSKVPLIKTASDWQLPLHSLLFLRLTGDTHRHASDSGLDYASYLRFLLFLKNADRLTASLMDLVEMNLQTEKERPDFRLDACLDALRIELHARIGRNDYTIERSYGYNAA